MFVGEYRHQVDEKYRLRIPAKLKEQLGENPFIMRGTNNSLVVFKKDEAESLLKDMFKDIAIADPEKNKPLRLIMSSGFFAEEDKQGRILLPPALIKHSKISKNIVTIGAFNRVEIWSEENWDSYCDVESEEFDESLSQIVSGSKVE